MMTKDIQKKILEVRNSPHCKNCGLIDPEMVEGGDLADAYTKCCNELVCDRAVQYQFGNEKVSVTACCWAVAELEFTARGIDVTQQQGMWRLS